VGAVAAAAAYLKHYQFVARKYCSEEFVMMAASG
jgi:hypothetical protein